MVLTDTRIKNIILEEMILFQEELSLKTLNQNLHFFIAKESGWEFPCYEYRDWYHNSLDYEGKQFYLKEFSRQTIQSGNSDASFLLTENLKRISSLRQTLADLGLKSSKNTTKLAKVSRRVRNTKKGSKAYKKAKKEYDALVKSNRELSKKIKDLKKEIGKLRAKGQTQSTVSAKSNQALKNTDTLAKGIEAEKTLRTAAKDLNVSDKVLRNPNYIRNNVPPQQRQSLLNALKDVKAADKLAKSKNMRITQKVKVKGKTETVKIGKAKGKDGFKGDMNQASAHLGSTSKFKLDKKGRMKLSKEMQHLPPSLIRRAGSKTWDVLKSPVKIKPIIDMFKNLGRRAMDFVKRNPLKFAFLTVGVLPLALVGLYLYNHYKTDDMPDVPQDVVDKIEEEPVPDTTPEPTPTPDVGPVTPARKSKCAINNRLVKNIFDLGGSNLKEGYKDMQSNLHAAGYANLMPKTFSDGVDKPDGICGPETISAITQFQKDNPPLKVDGLYGPLTHAKMKEVLEKKVKKEKNKDNEIEWRLNKIQELEAELASLSVDVDDDGEIDVARQNEIAAEIKTLKQQIAIFRGAKLQTIDQTLKSDIDKAIEKYDAEISKLSKQIQKLEDQASMAREDGDESKAESLEANIKNLSRKLATQITQKSEYVKEQEKLKAKEPAPVPTTPDTPSKKTKTVKIIKKKTVPTKKTVPAKKTEPKTLTVLQQVLQQHPGGTNLVGKGATVSVGGNTVKIRFSKKGMTVNGQLWKFEATDKTFSPTLNVDKVVISGSGKSVTMKMSFMGQSGSASFGESQLKMILKKLVAGKGHVVSGTSAGRITIKKG